MVEQIQKISKKETRKNFLKLLGASTLTLPFMTPLTSANLFLRKEDSSIIDFNNINPLSSGITQGQLAFWNGSKWTYIDISKLSWDNINKILTFGNFPITPSSAPTTNYQVANKKYVDDNTPSLLWGTITGTLSNQTDLQNELNNKEDSLGFTPENVINKSSNTSLGTSNILYPTQNAVKTYVDNNTGLWETDINDNATLKTQKDIFIEPNKKLYFDYNV